MNRPLNSPTLIVSRRGAISWDALATAIGILVVFVLGSRWLWIKYSRSQIESQSPYVPLNPEDPTQRLTTDEILQRLLTAVDRRDYGVITVYAKALFEDRADVDLNPAIDGLRDPVLRAALDGDVKLFESLAAARSAFGGADDAGRRAIHVVAANNHSELVRWLVGNNLAQVDEPVRATGLTPLHIAASESATDAVAALLALGADSTKVTARNRNVLHSAADRGAILGAAAVLNGVDLRTRATLITAQDDEGNTPLHLAARSGRADLVRLLVEAGSSRGTHNAAEKTAADVAGDEGHDDVVALLTE